VLQPTADKPDPKGFVRFVAEQVAPRLRDLDGPDPTDTATDVAARTREGPSDGRWRAHPTAAPLPPRRTRRFDEQRADLHATAEQDASNSRTLDEDS
jgi:hypothetical protein